MEEKIIIKTEKISVKSYLPSVLIFCGAAFLAAFIIIDITIQGGMFFEGHGIDGEHGIAFLFAAIPLLFYFIFVMMAASELVVTDKRVYGKIFLGKRVDLPLDAISAVALTFFLFQGLSVSTSSGRITFFFLKERNEMHKAISQLIVERQTAKRHSLTAPAVPQSEADELKKYKDLLDSGVINQEEFDAKKKQLLGL